MLFRSFEVIAASARIDAVVASITKLSRSSALEFFSAKKVFLNGMNIENNSAQLKPGDILVIRGFGKFIFDGCGNETRKGREIGRAHVRTPVTLGDLVHNVLP